MRVSTLWHFSDHTLKKMIIINTKDLGYIWQLDVSMAKIQGRELGRGEGQVLTQVELIRLDFKITHNLRV